MMNLRKIFFALMVCVLLFAACQKSEINSNEIERVAGEFGNISYEIPKGYSEYTRTEESVVYDNGENSIKVMLGAEDIFDAEEIEVDGHTAYYGMEYLAAIQPLYKVSFDNYLITSCNKKDLDNFIYTIKIHD